MEMKIKNFYNLNLHTLIKQGSSFKGAELIAIMDYRTATKFTCVDNLQKQHAPYLPPNTPRDHTRYTYYQFKHRGETVIIADMWIDQKSIEVSKGENYRVMIYNTSSKSMADLNEQLRLLDLEFEIEAV